MTRLILVPLDGSPLGASALPLAVAIAQRNGAELQLVHVHQRAVQLLGAPASALQFELDAEKLMGRELADTAQRVRIETHLLISATFIDGPVAETLARHIAANRPWLVVMNSHGRGGFRRMMHGSVADALARHAGVPVLIARHDGGMTTPQHTVAPVFRNILVPLDGSAPEEEIAEYAMALGEPGRTTFTLLRVVVPSPMFVAPAPGPPVPFDRVEAARQHDEVLARLGDVARTFELRGFAAVPQVVVHSQPGPAILEFAAEHPTDMIALATHGRGGLARAILGSVADHVMRHATVSVLLYAAPHVMVHEDSRRSAEAGQPS